MATVSPNPLFMSNYTVEIGSDSYEKAVSSIVLTPNPDTVTFQGGTPDAIFQFAKPSTWVATLEFAQDWTSSTSLAGVLFASEGETQTLTFVPEVGSDAATITVSVLIVPGAIGGAQGAIATGTVSLPVNGKPAITFAS